jgi:drug/metabolite transporter (DMT)-like permease
MPISKPARITIIAQMLLCSFLWASSFLAIKKFGLAFPPLTLTALRGLLGGGLLTVWVAAAMGPKAVLPSGGERRDWLVEIPI